MGIHVLTDAKIYVGAYNFSGNFNNIEVPWGRDAVENTAFGATTHTFMSGLGTTKFTASGFTDFGATAIEKIISTYQGAIRPITVSAQGGDAGEIAYFFNALITKLQGVGGNVGAAHGFSLEADLAQYGMLRGTIIEDGKTGRATTAAGTAYQLGAVVAGQSLYGVIHAIAAPGTTIDVIIESDSVEAFNGTPETRITFAQITTSVSYELKVAAGANTDAWYRASWTIAGSGPYNIVVAAAIV